MLTVGKDAREVERKLRAGQFACPLCGGRLTPFTDRAYRAVIPAEAEALGLRHSYVGTEHLLLGLLGIGDGVAAQVLTRLGVTSPMVRSEIEQIIGRGSAPPAGQPPLTP